MSRPVWFVKFLRKLFPFKETLAKATHFSPIGKIVDNMLFKNDEVYFVPNNRTITLNKSIEKPGSYVLPTDIVRHFIEKANDIWIMNTCQCRDSLKCENYPVTLGCLFMGTATRGINVKLGKPVSKAKALDHVQRANELGLIHMMGRNKLDTFWMGIGPGYNLLTVCFCCPCCCLWTTLPRMTPKISTKLQRMPGVSVSVNNNCTGCEECTRGVCFVDAIQIQDDVATINDECRGCGRCYVTCQYGAIDYNISDSNYVDTLIKRISKVVDVE